MKNVNQLKNQIKKLHKNNKGIETRVLIYILAAIALIAAIYIVNQVNQKAGQMSENAMVVASANANLTGSKATCNAAGYATNDDCTDTDCPSICCTEVRDTNKKLTDCNIKYP
jgi:hypothetical protein